MNRPIPVPPCCTSTDYSGPSALEPQPGTRFWLACNQAPKQKTNKLQSITVKWMLSIRFILPFNRLFKLNPSQQLWCKRRSEPRTGPLRSGRGTENLTLSHTPMAN